MSLTDFSEPQPSLAWQFESSNVDYVTNRSPVYSTTDTATTYAPTYQTGKYNLGMRLQNNSGTQANTWVRYTFSASIPIDPGVSISCWVKYTTLTSTQSAVATLYDNITSGFANTLSIGMTTSGTVGYSSGSSFYNSNLVPNSISGTYSAGTWYHLSVTFNSSSIIGYLNGIATTPKTTLTTGLSFAGFRLGTYVNNFNDNSGFSPADCTIDDLRIYNTALTASQVQSIYTQGGSPASNFRVMPKPSLAWSFESSNVDYITNLSPSSQVSPGPAQLVGGASLVTNAPSGSNTAVSFDGSSGYMNLGTSSTAVFDNSTSNLFVECWVYMNANTPAKQQYIIMRDSASSPGTQDDWGLRYSPYSSGFQFYCYGTSVSTEVSSGAVAIGQWVHVSVSLTNVGNMYLFINGGTPITNSTTGTPRYVSGRTVYIGSPGVVSDWTWSNMYIRDLRIVQGGVVPVASFTPGAAPFTYASPGYVANMGTTVFTLLGQFVTYNPSGKYGSSLVVLAKDVGGDSTPAVKYWTYPFNFGTNLMTGFTVCHWIKFFQLPAAGTRSLIWGCADAYFNQNTGSITSGMYTGSGYPGATYNFTPVLGTWYHYTSVYGNGTIITYLNGSQVATAGFAAARTLTNSTVNIASDGGVRQTSAEYDDFRIYNTALSWAQVQSIYQAQGMPSRGVTTSIPNLEPALGLYAPFNNSTSDLIRSSAPTSINVAPTFDQSGKYGACVVIQNDLATPTTTGLSYPQITLNSQTGVSFSFWIKFIRLTPSGTRECLIDNYPFYAYFYTQLFGQTGFYMNFYYNNPSAVGGTAPFSPVVDTWYHVVYTIGGSVCKIYINGTLRQTTSSFSPDISWTNYIKLAYSNNGGESPSIKLDDFRVYNTALSASQVSSLYNTFTPYSIQLTGAPLFNQLSQSAASSAVGAFSLRAVNGTSAKAVQVRPVAALPPTGFTSAVTNPGGNQYNQTLTGYAFGGAGAYTSNCSSVANDGNTPRPWKAFDYDTLTWWENNYGVDPGYNAIGSTSTSNAYSGLYTTTVSGSSIGGEWLQLGLPIAVVLYSYSMYNRSGFNGHRMPYQWVVAGSNDGITWATVDSQTGITWTTATQTFTTTSTTPYLYFRMIVRDIQTGGQTNQPVNIGQWTLNGSNASWNTDFYADERGNLLTVPVTGQLLANWLGGATGYVTKWYDQTGKGNDASQISAANQPIIQRATKGPGYACLFNGTTNYLTGMSYTVLNNTNYSFSVVERRNSSTVEGYFISSGNQGTNQGLHIGYSTNTLFRFGQWYNDLDINPYTGYISNEPLHYWAGTQSSTSGRYLYDKTNNTVTSNVLATSSLYSTSGNFVIGARPYYTGYYSGEIYEVIVFTQSLYDLDGTTSITQIYNSQVGYTGT